MNIMKKCNYILKYTETHHDINVILSNKQTNKQILYYPQTLYSVQGVKTTGAWGMDFVSSSPFSLLPPPPFSKFSYKSFLFQNFHNHSFFLHLTISVDVIHHEKTNDYENFEKGMIYMKILKKGGVVEKRGRRKRNPCPMRLWSKHQTNT